MFLDIDKKAIGARIKSIRLEKGLTLHEFGNMIGGADRSIASRWERGVSLPNNERLKTIAEIGGTTVDFLLYGSLDDYARRLLKELEKELNEDDSINKGAID